MEEIFEKSGRELFIGFIASNICLTLEIYRNREKLDAQDKEHINEAIGLCKKAEAGFEIMKGTTVNMKDSHDLTPIYIYNRILWAYSDMSLETLKANLIQVRQTLEELKNSTFRLEEQKVIEMKEFFKRLVASSIQRNAILLKTF